MLSGLRLEKSMGHVNQAHFSFTIPVMESSWSIVSKGVT